MTDNPAAISFHDEGQEFSRQALLYSSTKTPEEAKARLQSLKASWPVTTIDGYPGCWVTPQAGDAIFFASVLMGMGDDWELRADPR